jgi:GT2 family glycosyltransferase
LSHIEDGVVAVSGSLRMPIPNRPSDEQRTASQLTQSEFVTANCFCRREMLEKIGGFDERFRLAWREDSDLQFRLLEWGRIVKAPEALVIHPYRPVRWGHSVKRECQVFYDALLYKKHPALFREKIASRTPWDYYAITGLLALACVGALANAHWTSRAAAIAWITATVGLTLKRLKGTSGSWAHVAEMVITSALIPPVSVFWRLRGAWSFQVAYF